jgi:chemotaxis protein MotB
MPSRRKRRDHEEEHGSHERWMITYADMVTLLMVLFIVMFAISQVDQKKFEALREGMAAGFGQQPSPMSGDRSILTEAGQMPMPPIGPEVEVSEVEHRSNRQKDESPPVDDSAEQRRKYAEARAEVERLEALRKRVARALKREGLLHDVAMKIDERGLRISLVSRHIVFRPNIADLSKRGRRVLDVLSPVLGDLPNRIEVAGHTNQVPVKPKYYPTDWELSAARAVTVLRYLHERGGVPAENMLAAAYGHEQPLIDPEQPRSQQLNKRVDVIVMSAAREDVRGLFADVLRDIRIREEES